LINYKEIAMSNELVDEDQWSTEGFEDTVAKALIACFETKLKKAKSIAPEDRLGEEHLLRLRRRGIYIPSPSRVIETPETDQERFGMGEHWAFDMVNDTLPTSGCLAITDSSPRPGMDVYDGYLHAFMFDQRLNLGRGWHKRAAGTIYEIYIISPGAQGVDGERRYITVAKDGKITACQKIIRGTPQEVVEPHVLSETEAWGCMALHTTADKRFCWSIAAQDLGQAGTALVGCMREEIKSLLYARSLPMSETGRKKPILHLVEAHKRRMRNGIEIDITGFLRGQDKVEIGSTLFTVNPPKIIQAELSKNSQKFFPTEQV
jgi:hypothetical protein